MPYAQIDDGVAPLLRADGARGRAGDAPVRRRPLRPPQLRPRQRRLPRAGFRLLSFDARGYGASTSPREGYTIEGWADDGAELLDAVGARARARPRHVDGRDDRDRLHRHVPGARPSPPAPTSLREAGRLPAHALPRLAPDGRVDAVGRLLRPRHDAGGRRAVHGEPGGRGHVRARPLGRRRSTTRTPCGRRASRWSRWISRRSSRRSSGRC